MKTNAISSIKKMVMSTVKNGSKESTSGLAVKDGEKLIAAGQDSIAAQNKAMIKKVYTKPEMEVSEMKMQKRDLKAASGYDDGSHRGSRRSNDWDDDWDY